MLSSVLDSLGIALSIVAVVLLPGAALLAAVLPGNRLSLAERLMLSIGLSLSLSVLVGLVLNWTVHDFGRLNWVVGLGTVSVIALGVALVRLRGRVMTDHSTPPRVEVATESTGPQTVQRRTMTRRDVVLLGIAGMLGTSAILADRLGIKVMPREGYSQLWILPVTGISNQIQLGIHSFEQTQQSFVLEVGEGGAVLQRWPSLTIEMGGVWESTVTLPTGTTQSRVIYARLYLLDRPNEIYRQVTLSIGQ